MIAVSLNIFRGKLGPSKKQKQKKKEKIGKIIEFCIIKK